MANIYGSAKICPFDNQNCDLNGDGLYLDPGEYIRRQPSFDHMDPKIVFLIESLNVI